mmetsp:Transcript_30026/g.82410  ORF Transcript_30026/g.82410 Transcript_30026/m.82410 type:complete len:315 (+) Transcript_30026:318-1262(+)
MEAVATKRPSGVNAAEKTSPRCPVKLRSGLPVSAAQIVANWEHVMSLQPSGANATEYTLPQPPNSPMAISRALPLPSARHILAVPSELPVAMREPSGSNVTDKTAASCPLSVVTSSPSCARHTFARRSSDPETIVSPSGAKTTAFTAPRWPPKAAIGLNKLPRSAPHTFAVPSALPVAKAQPSGEKTAEDTASVCASSVPKHCPFSKLHNLATPFSAPDIARRSSPMMMPTVPPSARPNASIVEFDCATSPSISSLTEHGEDSCLAMAIAIAHRSSSKDASGLTCTSASVSPVIALCATTGMVTLDEIPMAYQT